MVEPLRHRQTKGAATDMFYLTPPRHISTLHLVSFRCAQNSVAIGNSGHYSTLVLNGSVANDRAARLAAIPAGESPANRGVQSLL